jgi:hypothetical protein
MSSKKSNTEQTNSPQSLLRNNRHGSRVPAGMPPEFSENVYTTKQNSGYNGVTGNSGWSEAGM